MAARGRARDGLSYHQRPDRFELGVGGDGRGQFTVQRQDQPLGIVQPGAINSSWPKLALFYGDHIIRTVTSGPTYKAFDEINSIIFPVQS